MIKWWATQIDTQGITSCPMCRFEPSNEEIMYFGLRAGARRYVKKISQGKNVLNEWCQKMRSLASITPMEEVLDAPEFYPSS